MTEIIRKNIFEQHRSVKLGKKEFFYLYNAKHCTLSLYVYQYNSVHRTTLHNTIETLNYLLTEYSPFGADVCR